MTLTVARYSRQEGLLPSDVLRSLPITVAGVGAVGRQVVLQLLSAGARNITIYDPDVVEEGNIGPQGWAPSDIGKLKVNALYDEACDRYRELTFCDSLKTCPRRFPRVGGASDVLFCCVDSIETRSTIHEAYRGQLQLFLDSRVAGDTVHILAACENEEHDYYSSTIFAPEDAYEGSCTTRMGIHIANIAAGLLVQQLSKWLRNLPLDRHTIFNLLAMEAYEK